MSDQQNPQICTGCDKPTSDGAKFLAGVLCPVCDKNWNALIDALEEHGGLHPAGGS